MLVIEHIKRDNWAHCLLELKELLLEIQTTGVMNHWLKLFKEADSAVALLAKDRLYIRYAAQAKDVAFNNTRAASSESAASDADESDGYQALNDLIQTRDDRRSEVLYG